MSFMSSPWNPRIRRTFSFARMPLNALRLPASFGYRKRFVFRCHPSFVSVFVYCLRYVVSFLYFGCGFFTIFSVVVSLLSLLYVVWLLFLIYFFLPLFIYIVCLLSFWYVVCIVYRLFNISFLCCIFDILFLYCIFDMSFLYCILALCFAHTSPIERGNLVASVVAHMTQIKGTSQRVG